MSSKQVIIEATEEKEAFGKKKGIKMTKEKEIALKRKIREERKLARKKEQREKIQARMLEKMERKKEMLEQREKRTVLISREEFKEFKKWKLPQNKVRVNREMYVKFLEYKKNELAQ